MTISAEIGHVYTSELMKHGGTAEWLTRVEREAALVPHADVWLLFIDDYPDAYTYGQRQDVAALLCGLAKQVGVDFDAVAFESDCAQAASVLSENLPHDDGWIERVGRDYKRAVRIKKDEPGLWECPALAAIWTLARLGVDPYFEAVYTDAVKMTGRFVADTVLTVLPVTYIDNEANVLDIIRQLRKPRVPLNRVRYVLA